MEDEKDEYMCPMCGFMVDVEEFAFNNGMCNGCANEEIEKV